jgi:hypothetical protein
MKIGVVRRQSITILTSCVIGILFGVRHQLHRKGPRNSYRALRRKRQFQPLKLVAEEAAEAVDQDHVERWLPRRSCAGIPVAGRRRARLHVVGDDLPSAGWYRSLLQAGEQGLAGLRRGAQQQDPSYPTTSLWASRRRVPSTQNPYLHAASALTPFAVEFA